MPSRLPTRPQNYCQPDDVADEVIISAFELITDMPQEKIEEFKKTTRGRRESDGAEKNTGVYGRERIK